MAEQYGFFVDSRRCVKCYACEVACQQWHGLQATAHMRRIVHESCAGVFPEVTRTFTSLSCMHCEKPACAAVCPVHAIEKRSEDGVVIVDKQKCIGCRSCALACPFDVPRYGIKKVMDKCDTCLDLGRKADELPRCVTTCPTKALSFGPLGSVAIQAQRQGGKRMEGDTLPTVYIARR